jgi:arylsulfatase A-like enzyme
MSRVDWRDLDLPPGHPGAPDAIRAVLAQKPAHWLRWYEGTFSNAEGGPMNFFPATLTDDQIREINARVHVMNELIDEALGRVLRTVDARGWGDDTDVIFTTDHGELQGDYGFVYKGPWHTDSLMRLPLVWRPARSAGAVPAVVTDPVGQVDLAPTFCAIAGIAPAEWMQGTALPVHDGAGRHERALCEWDSQFPGYGMHLRSIYRDGWLCTAYESSTAGKPNGLEQVMGDSVLSPTSIQYDGTEGELYRVDEDPHAFRNLWDDPAHRSIRDELVADLRAALPAGRADPLLVEAPA